MEKQAFSTLTIATLMGCSFVQAANLETPLPILFQNSPTKLGRSIDSISEHTRHTNPTLSFKSSLRLDSHGMSRVASDCTLVQTTRKSNDASENSYYNAPLAHAPGGTIEANTSYEMRLISYQEEVLQIELSHPTAKVSHLELTCTHPLIQTWTISEFESHLAQRVKVHFLPTLAESKMTAPVQPRETMLVQDLKGSVINGIFGSGLPGTMGIQLLLGTNLKAYGDEINSPIVIGKRCKLMSQKSDSINDQYLKGSKFAFRESHLTDDQGNLELVFNNWSHSPHEVRVECKGSLNHAPMTVAEVERDLNGTIQFYHK